VRVICNSFIFFPYRVISNQVEGKIKDKRFFHYLKGWGEKEHQICDDTTCISLFFSIISLWQEMGKTLQQR
jgi:hypothetical protein